MTDGCVDYDETTDLYMQMLWEARKVEDKRLAKLILHRIQSRRPSERVGKEANANIVPFPMAQALCVPSEPEIPFWKQQQFWQDVILFGAFLSFFIGWFFFFMHLLAQVNPLVR
ncbi:MAG: hypothetical protein LJE65_06400 [Desulfobacteraceae bacterium]|jgi:hypothetical protein|nr:hypothetical protein [Desulfobacteraceae bacterium]